VEVTGSDKHVSLLLPGIDYSRKSFIVGAPDCGPFNPVTGLMAGSTETFVNGKKWGFYGPGEAFKTFLRLS
jgi:hypothetical protein